MSLFEKISGVFRKPNTESPRPQHEVPVAGDEKKKFESADTMSAGELEKAWSAKVTSEAEDRERLDNIRKGMADLAAAQSMWQSAGSKEAYMKEAEDAAKAWKERLDREKEIERSQIEQQRAKQVEDLKTKSVVKGIDQALQQEDERQAEERARRRRLGLN